MININELRKSSLTALLLAFMASAMLPACSSTEETEDAPPPEDTSMRDEVCDEADIGTTDCG